MFLEAVRFNEHGKCSIIEALQIVKEAAGCHQERLMVSQDREGLSWLYRLCRSDADRAILAARGITPATRVHHVSELEKMR